MAGSMALRAGAAGCGPVLLEPVMKVEVVTPEDYYGDIVGDLNRRRGVVLGRRTAGQAGQGRGAVEMFGYATDMRSATQGRAGTSPWNLETMKCSRRSLRLRSVERPEQTEMDKDAALEEILSIGDWRHPYHDVGIDCHEIDKPWVI